MNDRRLTILQILPRLDVGGAERVAIECAEAVSMSGHRALIAAEAGALHSMAQRARAEWMKLPLATKNPLKIWRNAGRLVRLAKAEGVDLLHAHSRAPAWSGLMAARKLNLPFITTYHGVYGEGSAFKRRYNRVMVRGERVIAVSHYVAGVIRARYGLDERRVRVVHGGVDVHVFNPAAVLGDRAARLARVWRADDGRPAIMLPGRLTSLKGQEIFIRALAAMRNADALGILVGSDQGRGDYTARLVALAEKLGVAARLRIVGHAEDMPATLMLADIVVNCSTVPEAFGRTIIEAQAMGRIVVATDHGGARETIEPGQSGFLVPPGDAHALAETLDHLLDMGTEARIDFGQQARAHVAEHFSLRAMQSRVLDVYAEVLG